MAIDGLVLSNIIYELQNNLIGGKIDKINQPEKDELIFSIRANRVNHKLLLTTEASNPRIHLTKIVKANPMTPPSLCMLFRKHLVGGKIIDIQQINMDRVVVITVEHYDEMNDIRQKRLIIEIMGRHSNIILVDEENLILESVKRVSQVMSSFREVFPGRFYSEPPGSDKTNPLSVDNLTTFKSSLITTEPVIPSLYKSFYGFSGMVGDSMCSNAEIDGSSYISELSDQAFEKLYFEFQLITNDVKNHEYNPYIILDADNLYVDFHTLKLSLANNPNLKHMASISELIDDYYETRTMQVRLKQKTLDMRKLVQTHLDRSKKKLELQERQLIDTKDKEKFKIKGELIQANLYQIPEGVSNVTVLNYYTNEDMVISLDPNLTPIENATKAFEKYGKKKRTEVAIAKQIEL
nr:NFACT family protein [Vallitaleaceae bacterium]